MWRSFGKGLVYCGIFGIGLIVGAYGFLELSDYGRKLKQGEDVRIYEAEYLDVEDFARLAKRSIYCIWGCIPNKLADYTRNINGQKRIHRDGLKLFN